MITNKQKELIDETYTKQGKEYLCQWLMGRFCENIKSRDFDGLIISALIYVSEKGYLNSNG